jgi:membrane associated rhomboid family serine protease
MQACIDSHVIVLTLILAGFGGTFMSMAFEDPCYVYVGASGAVFGFIGECYMQETDCTRLLLASRSTVSIAHCLKTP